MTMSSRRGRALLCPLNPDIFIGRSRTPPLRGTIVLFHPVFFQTFDPGVYTYRSLVVFVHFIQGETDAPKENGLPRFAHLKKVLTTEM